MVLIGLLGIKNSGKTTASNFLVNTHHFVEFSFATCLKRACQELFLLTDEQVFGSQEQKETPDEKWFGCTPRKILQFIGTDLLRENLDKIMPGLGKDIFIHHFKIWYQNKLSKNPNIHVVVSDVRFQNEVDAIHQLGGKIVKIERPCIGTNDLHPSEMEQKNIQNYDFFILNDGSLCQFLEKFDKMILG